MTLTHRWLFRRQRKLLAIAVLFLISILIYSVTFHNDVPIREHNDADATYCRSSLAREMITGTCEAVSLDQAFGDLCTEMCTGPTPLVTGCIHRPLIDVIFTRLKNNDVIVKRKAAHSNEISKKFSEFTSDRLTNGAIDVHDFFKSLVAKELRRTFADNASANTNSVDEVITAMFGHPISQLTVAQMKSSWDLIVQREFMFLVLLKDLTHLPDMLGSCGSLYSLEATDSYRLYFPETVPRATWKERTGLALQFLELVRELESHSDPGPLLYCDWQESNFGVTTATGEMSERQLKMIDLGKLYTKEALSALLTAMPCTQDDDCVVVDCASKCDTTRKTCTAVMRTSNLQLMCRDILLTRWPVTGLLGRYQPADSQNSITRLLAECSSDTYGELEWLNAAVKGVVTDLAKLFGDVD